MVKEDKGLEMMDYRDHPDMDLGARVHMAQETMDLRTRIRTARENMGLEMKIPMVKADPEPAMMIPLKSTAMDLTVMVLVAQGNMDQEMRLLMVKEDLDLEIEEGIGMKMIVPMIPRNMDPVMMVRTMILTHQIIGWTLDYSVA